MLNSVPWLNDPFATTTRTYTAMDVKSYIEILNNYGYNMTSSTGTGYTYIHDHSQQKVVDSKKMKLLLLIK